MTLDTRIMVAGQVDHRAVFVRCNQLLGATEATRCQDQRSEYGTDGEWIIENLPGQGLPGWLMIHYRPGAALRPEVAHDSDCEPGCTYARHTQPCWLEISLDTSYGYSDALGGCGNLHARFVSALGAWLDEQGIRWGWVNEFTGEYHWGTEGLRDLGCFAGARHWLAGTVLPAITRGAS